LAKNQGVFCLILVFFRQILKRYTGLQGEEVRVDIVARSLLILTTDRNQLGSWEELGARNASQ
jgi:hypothetical protein